MTLKVYVAEKPALGRAIAKELAKRSPRTGGDGSTYVEGADWAVCWGKGHLYQLADPDYYHLKNDPAAPKGGNGKVKWSFDHLPLLVGSDEWKMQPSPGSAELRGRIKQLVSRATVLVHAGDPDREGQTLVDEIIKQNGWKKSVRRVLIGATDEVTVARGVADEKDNADYAGLSAAGRARARSDWMVGMNLTEACSLQAGQSGYQGVLAIGRVQTPLLGLMVARELEIRNFVPIDHFGLSATIVVRDGRFSAKWIPREGQAGLDAHGRVTDQRAAQAVHARVKGQTGTITQYNVEKKRVPPEAPFSIEQLQMLMSKRFGYKSEQTLSLVQGLYDRSLVTYPRSGSRLLPEDQFHEAPRVLDNISSVLESAVPTAKTALDTINPATKSKAWTDKYGAHHAIIPTQQRANVDSMSVEERNVYIEICKRYAAQFMPPYEYNAAVAEATISGERFKATGSTPISPGWRALYGGFEAAKSKHDVVLPKIQLKEPAECSGLDLVSKRTEPPSRFTDSTLLEAMINVHRYVEDPRVKAIFERMLAALKGGDEEAVCGLGTPATRHTFVPKLVSRGLLITQAKGGRGKEEEFVPTEAGMGLIAALPREVGRPDMTALWESAFDQIQSGAVDADQFLQRQGAWIKQTIDAIRAKPIQLPQPVVPKRASGGGKSGSKSFGGKGRGVKSSYPRPANSAR